MMRNLLTRRTLFSSTETQGSIPLRRRSSDFSVYVLTSILGIASACYIFLEPLRSLRAESLREEALKQQGDQKDK